MRPVMWPFNEPAPVLETAYRRRIPLRACGIPVWTVARAEEPTCVPLRSATPGRRRPHGRVLPGPAGVAAHGRPLPGRDRAGIAGGAAPQASGSVPT
jgi:hypothetical protein